MRESPDLFFTKTHKRYRGDKNEAIYLVRDGRDAIVSQARLHASEQFLTDGDHKSAFETCLREVITRPYIAGQPSSGTWGGNVPSWLGADVPIAVLRYEELIVDPRGIVTRTVATLLPELAPVTDADIPSFHELRNRDETFFRRGAALSYKDELPQGLHELFWAQPENALAMQRLGYSK